MTEQFELKSEHVEMLKEAYWRDSPAEEQMPQIDSKRPFGFSGNIVGSAAEELDGYDSSSLTDEEHKFLKKCLNELTTAVRVILDSESFVPGTYEKRDGDWVRID